MDGHYLSKKEELVEFLQNWIKNVINEKLWEKFIDLHITEIGKDFLDKSSWVEGSLFLFDCILELVNKSIYDVFLVIPLRCSNSPNRNHIDDTHHIDNELDITPPSFYLFPKNNRNFEDTIKSAKYLKEISKELKFKVFYKEEKQGDEYYRTLYIRRL